MNGVINHVRIKRINGYLNLDEYFRKILKKEYIDEEDLYNHGLIDVAPNGVMDKFWIVDRMTGQNIALFKTTIHNSYSGYAELISEEISRLLDMPTAHYDLATFNGYEGVISYNFVKNPNSYFSGFDIILDFYEQKLKDDEVLSAWYNIDNNKDTIDDVTDKLNNLEDIWSILEYRYRSDANKQAIIMHFMDRLIDNLIIDILTINVDDHSDNWGINGDELSPHFDKARIINLHRRDFITIETLEEKKLLLTVDNQNIRTPLKVLDHFLKVSSSCYFDRVKEKVDKLQENFELIPEIIEQRTHQEMPIKLKEYFINTISSHLEKVEEVLNNNSNYNYVKEKRLV